MKFQRSDIDIQTILRRGYHILARPHFALLFMVAWLWDSGYTVDAQEPQMSIAAFYLEETDLTANRAGSIVIDPQDGKPCALIKIVTTEQGFTFDFGLIKPCKREEQNAEHPSEIWLYVPSGAMKMSIQHRLLGKIDNYDLGSRLKSGRTYVLKLTTKQVSTFTYDESKRQYLNLTVSPSSAEVIINGMPQTLDKNGQASILLSLGQYRLSVKAEGYHPLEQLITMDEFRDKHLDVRLKPNFGWLSIDSFNQAQGAKLYIDGAQVDTLPTVKKQLNSGPHNLLIRHPLYKEYSEQITIKDSIVTTWTPQWISNYADISISVDNDFAVELYADGVSLGHGDWHGRLSAGKHLLEARKENHTTTFDTLYVNVGAQRTISMPAPTPLYGTLEVRAIPAATISIDGNVLGQDTTLSSTVLIGNHQIRFQRAGYQTESVEVNITQGETTRIERELKDSCNFRICSTPFASVYIDDYYVGTTPYHFTREAGIYNLTIEKYDYRPYHKRLRLNGGTPDIDIRLKPTLRERLRMNGSTPDMDIRPHYVTPYEIYLQVGYNVHVCTGISATMGGYINNKNMELGFIFPSKEKEHIYWSDPTDKNKEPLGAIYQPRFGFLWKFGYGFRVGRCVRLTPQIGILYVQLKEIPDTEDVVSDPDGSSYSIGMRCSWALCRHIGITLTPEYLASLLQADGYKQIANVSNKIKSLGCGFNINVGFNFFY